MKLNFLEDRSFLKKLDNQKLKTFFVKINIYDRHEVPVSSIEGQVTSGNITINANSSMRRTCNLTFIPKDKNIDIKNMDKILSANKRIQVFEGFKNDIDKRYDDIVWFPLGHFIICQFSITHNLSNTSISLSCKDKMCLLNGECGGGLPTSITFHEYDQVIGLTELSQSTKYQTIKFDSESISVPNIENPKTNKVYKLDGNYYMWNSLYGWDVLTKEKALTLINSTVQVEQRIYDIIQTLVCNFGEIPISKIFIMDVPIQNKQLIRWTGSNALYYNNGVYTITEHTGDDWKAFKYNRDIGYVYTDFVYPGELISNIGDNVCSVLDKIISALGNYEYFFDVDGNFIFREIKNYLNNSYKPIDAMSDGYALRLSDNDKLLTEESRRLALANNDLRILDNLSYKVDFNSNSKIVYEFKKNNGLITSYGNTPQYSNLKNDFHIWGKNNDGYAIHYHVAIKDKPEIQTHENIILITDRDEQKKYGKTLRLADEEKGEVGINYTPSDWRAELYIQGLKNQKIQVRPTKDQQELLDLFDSIYDFTIQNNDGSLGAFKTDMINNVNELNYFMDYIDPIGSHIDLSVDALGPRTHSIQQDKIIKLYTDEVPNYILINTDNEEEKAKKIQILTRCKMEGQLSSGVEDNIMKQTAIGTVGYSAQEWARTLLYQYTNYNEVITLQSIPIYYLDVNSRINVEDDESGIHGDYMITSISLPLDARSPMSISATKVIDRI